MNPMLKIAYDYGARLAVEELEKTAFPSLNRVFSDLSGIAGAGVTGATSGAIGGLLAEANDGGSLDYEDVLRSALTGAAGGAVAGSLGAGLQKKIRGDNLQKSLDEYDVADTLLSDRRALEALHKKHVASTVAEYEDELNKLRKMPMSPSQRRQIQNIKSNIRFVKNEPTSAFGANLFNNADRALSSDLASNKARAIAATLLPSGLGSLGGYGLGEFLED